MAKKRRNVVPTSEDNPEGFRRIKGLRKAIVEQLHAQGIHTYAQLAALSPTCVAELVGDTDIEGVAEQWIKKARKLASSLPPEEFRYDATFTVNLTLDAENKVQNTSVVHLQDRVKDRWSEWSDARLKDFIERHSAPHSKLEPPVETPPTVNYPSPEPMPERDREAMPNEFCLDMGTMTLGEAGFGQESDKGVTRKQLCALFDFQLSGPDAQQIATAGLPYFVQIIACDLANGQATVLATDQSSLAPGRLVYPSALQFSLPELGRYQVVGLVLLPDKKAGATLGAVLNVVP